MIAQFSYPIRIHTHPDDVREVYNCQTNNISFKEKY